MEFEGYLLKSGNDIFPHKYIEYSSWESTPNQREEIKAYRDDNTRDLTRVTAAGRKTAIAFKTRDSLTLDEKIEIQTFFTSHETDAAERKIPLTFWNDEDNEYKTGYFYRPNLKFPIKSISGNSIVYGSVQIDLVEY
jgi:hypothetical protein